MNRDILCHASPTDCGGARTAVRRRRDGGTPLIVLLCGALLLASLTAESVQSFQLAEAGTQAAYQSGVVTGLVGWRIEIDNTYYRLHEHVAVTTDEGTVLTVQDLLPGKHVRFHLQGKKIDAIIVMLAR